MRPGNEAIASYSVLHTTTAGHTGGHAHVLIGESDSLKKVLQFGDGTVRLHHPVEDLRDLSQSFLPRDHQVFLKRWGGGGGGI